MPGLVEMQLLSFTRHQQPLILPYGLCLMSPCFRRTSHAARAYTNCATRVVRLPHACVSHALRRNVTSCSLRRSTLYICTTASSLCPHIALFRHKFVVKSPFSLIYINFRLKFLLFLKLFCKNSCTGGFFALPLHPLSRNNDTNGSNDKAFFEKIYIRQIK